MFGFAWLILRQAQEALRNERLEEALRLIEQPAVRNHRRGGELQLELARAFVARGERHLRHEDADAAWLDLAQAELLDTSHRSSDRLRQMLTSLAMAQLRAILLSGDTSRAEEIISRLRHRLVHTTELGVFEEGLRCWVRAKDLASRGDFGLAVEEINKAGRLLGANPQLAEFHEALLKHRETFADLLARLHETARQQQWREVVELAQQVVTAAPQHVEARALREKAWRALGSLTVTHVPAAGSSPDTTVEQDAICAKANPTDPLPPRFYLWIDGVGGYLVCLNNRLTFGQAAPTARVDIPLIADVSKLHATLSRDAEGYVLEAVRPIHINGNTTNKALLQPNDRVTLGGSCQFLFRRPVPANNSARLDLVSGHRLPTSVDGVLLMAETLILAASEQSHVRVDDLKHPVVLFRHRDGIGVRHTGELRVNGVVSGNRAILPGNASISGNDISFAIEAATVGT